MYNKDVIQGQATFAKKMSHSGKVRAQASHLTKKVNKAEQLNQGIPKGEVSLYH
jgi:hypothetical protein